MMRLKNLLIFVPVALLMVSCDQKDNKITYPLVPPPAKPALTEPFKFHKLLEVAPGNYYDIFSWGRGTKDGGQYMILRSDSADQQYNAVNGDLEGPIKDVLNADLDTDGNPEIIIYANSIDTNRYTNVFVYEYQSDNARKLDFPRLTPSQRTGYHGNDNFYVKDSKLIREFPVKATGEGNAAGSPQKRILEYSLHGNSFSVKQLNTDSTSVVQPVKPQNAPPVKVAKKLSSKKTSSKKRKHTTERVTRRHTTVKKRRRHRR